MKTKIKKILSTISPELTTRLMFYYNFGKRLNLKNPSGLNEKLQYLKLRTYYNNPVITQCVDKYQVRGYLEGCGHGQLLPQLLGGPYSTPEALREDWDNLPNKFVIKCNHGCGYNILVTDKMTMDLAVVVNQLKQWMKEDFWKIYCEPQYRFVSKCVIVEEYLGDDIQTYKFYCIHGEPVALYVSSNGEKGEKDLYLDYYDMNWRWLPITLFGHMHARNQIPRPNNFENMVEISKDLSKDFPFVRVDLYNIDGEVKFSELTFIPTGGNMKLDPPDVLEAWGNMLNIEEKYPNDTGNC